MAATEAYVDDYAGRPSFQTWSCAYGKASMKDLRCLPNIETATKKGDDKGAL